MRRSLTFLAILIALPLFGQQTSTPEQTTTDPYARPQLNIPTAPMPGHPLDPNDVATLTGKNNQNQRQQNYATPQTYYTAPVGGSMFTQSSAGNAFGDGSNVGYGMMVTNGYGNGAYGYGLGGSQFANVTTATRPPFGFGPIGRPGASPFFFGRGNPGPFQPRWRPNVRFGPGSHFNHPTGLGFLPNPRP